MLLALRSLYERGVVVASQLEAFVLSDATARQLRRPASATEAASLGHSQTSVATVQVSRVEPSSLDSSTTQTAVIAAGHLESLVLASSWAAQLQAISEARESLLISDGIPAVGIYRTVVAIEPLAMETNEVSWRFKPIGIGAVAAQPIKGMTGAVVSFLGIQATAQVGAPVAVASSSGIQVTQVGFFIPEDVYLMSSWGNRLLGSDGEPLLPNYSAPAEEILLDPFGQVLTDSDGKPLVSNYTARLTNTLVDSWGEVLLDSSGNPLMWRREAVPEVLMDAFGDVLMTHEGIPLSYHYRSV